VVERVYLYVFDGQRLRILQQIGKYFSDYEKV